MKNKHITQINVYHTPDKVSKPDLQHQSHLKTTIPSVYQKSQPKSFSPYDAQHNGSRNYQFSGTGPIYSDKRASKNQWQLKQKVDEYQTQISLLQQYLRSCTCDCIQKNSIARIFGFAADKDRLQNQQQRVIKQLGTKVKSLIRQNSQLKSQVQVRQPSYNNLNVQQIIQQNHKLQRLLDEYKINDTITHQRLVQQGQMLMDQNYKIRIDYEQKIRLLQLEYQSKLSMFKSSQNELLRQMQLLQKQKQMAIKSTKLQQQKLNHSKIRQIQDKYNKQLKQTQNLWKQKLQDQERYYMRVKDQWEDVNREYHGRLKEEDLKGLKQYFIKVIGDVESQQKSKFVSLQGNVIQMGKRINKTNQSISHLKFERQNRLLTTIKKSRNIALVSSKPQGQQIQQKLVAQEHDQNVQINPKPLSYTVNTVHQLNSSKTQILNQKINYLERQITQLRTKLSIGQKIIAQKTQKVIILQNQIRNLNTTVYNMNRALNESMSKSKIGQEIVIKQVPVVPSDYCQQVRNIKQTIKSCNLSNFDIFQTQFNQIIQQRNQMNQKLQSLKKQAKQSSKILVLQKHLKVQRQRNKHLQQNLKRYQNEIQNLKIQIIQLQSEMDKIQANSIIEDVESMNVKQNLPDGKAGLEWQKVVKHCLLTSIKRLQNLQIKMKEDLGRNQ